jgi:hypothetical protein
MEFNIPIVKNVIDELLLELISFVSILKERRAQACASEWISISGDGQGV